MGEQMSSVDMVGTMAGIKEAFRLFETQSQTLQKSYDSLKRDLAVANERLNAKNADLQAKVCELGEMTVRLECILESLTDGVLVVNQDMRVERCNEAAASLMGIAHAEMQGMYYCDVTNGLGNERAVRAAITNGLARIDEQRQGHDRTGDEIHVLAAVAPIRTDDGCIAGAVEVLRDVTDLRRLEAQVQSRERMAALGEMAASVAHEIRNPLGTIEGFARLLRRDLADEPSSARLAEKIVEGAQNLNYVITTLLNYARPMALTLDSFAVDRLLADLEENLVAQALERGVVLDVRPTVVSGYGDPRQIRQVLLNLGINAIQACSEGDRVAVQAMRSHGRLLFKVADTGCGISKEYLDRIFDPFFTRKDGGTGLGLSLCHKIIEGHGGAIKVESNEGEGTCFTVTLPLQRRKEAA